MTTELSPDKIKQYDVNKYLEAFVLEIYLNVANINQHI